MSKINQARAINYAHVVRMRLETAVVNCHKPELKKQYSAAIEHVDDIIDYLEET